MTSGSAHTLDAMLVAVHELRERQLDHDMTRRDTATLLRTICQRLELAEETWVSVARWFDGGGPEPTTALSDGAVATTSLPIEVGAVLAAALELARRIEGSPAPDVIRGPSEVEAIARREIGGLRRERVIAIVCDAADRPLRTVVVSDGAIDRSLMPVREILNAALRWDGRAFAVAHNHPCGNPEPSDADIAATHRIAEAARVVGLRFLGHVVVGDGGWAVVPTRAL